MRRCRRPACRSSTHASPTSGGVLPRPIRAAPTADRRVPDGVDAAPAFEQRPATDPRLDRAHGDPEADQSEHRRSTPCWREVERGDDAVAVTRARRVLRSHMNGKRPAPEIRPLHRGGDRLGFRDRVLALGGRGEVAGEHQRRDERQQRQRRAPTRTCAPKASAIGGAMRSRAAAGTFCDRAEAAAARGREPVGELVAAGPRPARRCRSTRRPAG